MFTEFYICGPFKYLITVTGVLEHILCQKFTVKKSIKIMQ